MNRRMSRRSSADQSESTEAAWVAGTRGAAARRGPEHGVTLEELADRIAVEYGVDRDRAAAAADLYMRQLRRGPALAGY